ncbi:tetratricopeptide repeat protein [Indiicoccus explosivorum]|uniref:tetratricopeptide repeat protein n=1 Tax=Indiicoccus explosivorum TaxID=1917864 RepID=UPI001185E5A6|nr:tetratricopeptide repeat protein [Indiicoccus explosivorum]
MNVGNRIRRTRKLKGMTAGDVCAGIVSPSHFSNIENSRFTPATDTLMLIADRLSVPRSYFLNVHEDDRGVERLLDELDRKIEEGDAEEIKLFLEANEEALAYIPSIRQEIHATLLHFLALVKTGATDAAVKLYQEAIAHFDISPSSINLADQQKYYHISGLYFYLMRDYEKSIHFFKKVLDVKESETVRAKISFNIALALSNLRKYEEALKFAETATELYLRLHDWERTGNSYNLVAYVLIGLNRFDESEVYIQKGFDVTSSESKILHARLFHNWALIHDGRKETKEAIACINRAIELKTTSGQTDLFLSYRVKLDILLKAGDFLSFNKLLKAAESFSRTADDQAHLYFLSARFHYLFEDYGQYENSMKAAIELFLEENADESLIAASEHFSQFYEKNSKYKKALYYQKICTDTLKKIKER